MYNDSFDDSLSWVIRKLRSAQRRWLAEKLRQMNEFLNKPDLEKKTFQIL